MDGVPAAAVQELTQVPETRNLALTTPMKMPNPHADFQRFAIPCPKIVNGPVETVFCNWCHLPVDKAKVRLTSKTNEKYKCHRCNGVFAKCNKAQGVWPTPEFNAIPNEDQTDFYVEASSMMTTRQVIKLMETKLEN